MGPKSIAFALAMAWLSPALASPEPAITPLAVLHNRQAPPNVCGYWTDDSNGDATSTLTCDGGDPCLVYTATFPAVGYCANDLDIPVTTAYDFGDWPDTPDCPPGAMCCDQDDPDVQKFIFDNGATELLACGSEPLITTAFVDGEATFDPAVVTVTPSVVQVNPTVVVAHSSAPAPATPASSASAAPAHTPSGGSGSGGSGSGTSSGTSSSNSGSGSGGGSGNNNNNNNSGAKTGGAACSPTGPPSFVIVVVAMTIVCGFFFHM